MIIETGHESKMAEDHVIITYKHIIKSCYR